MNRLGAILLAFGSWSLVSADAFADEIARPANERFASETQEVPSFQRHVLPLMGRLGCNGRACHGSFQGQGGFRLSLFGYDFKADYEALLKSEKPRVDLADPTESLVLLKPTQEIPHKGGKRLDLDSWEHRLFTRWIQSGAKGVDDHDVGFERLEVSPSQIVFAKASETVQLKVVAVWRDGSREDVTPLCRFRTNDESISEVDQNGLVKSLGIGDTHIVAFYDNGVSTVQTLLPVSEFVGPKYPQVPVPTKVDQLVVEKLRTLGMIPSDLANDAEFLRRVSLDMTGTLPTPSEVEAFLVDSSSDKRSRKIDELLERPAYSAWWATRMCDVLGVTPQNFRGQEQQLGEKISAMYYRWVEKRVRENMPYDKIVEGLLVSSSRSPGQSYEDYVKEMATYVRNENPADFSVKETMPFYWMRSNFNMPAERAMSTAYAFLGIRLQCAQCHKHPFDQWTQDDFNQFTNFFGRVVYNQPTDKEDLKKFRELSEAIKKDKKLAGRMLADGQPYPFREVYLSEGAPASRKDDKNKKPKVTQSVTARALGDDPVELPKGTDPRAVLLNWMKEKDNPYLARAFVNRVWAAYFGVGIIEPADDLNLANPPSNGPLLDYLASAFIEKNYDMKWLHREIANSRTYQLSWQTNDTNKLDTRNFSHSSPRRLPAEVAYDAVKSAVADQGQIAKWSEDPSGRAIAITTGYARNGGKGNQPYALTVFGRPQRMTNCDCERSNDPSLLQTIYLRNDNDMLQTLASSGWLREIDKQLGVQTAEEARKKQDETRKRQEGQRKEQALQQRKKQIKQAMAKFEERLTKAKADNKTEEVADLEKNIASLRQKLQQLKADPAKTEETPVETQKVVASAPVKLTESQCDAFIREAYLRTVSRPPTAEELQKSRQYVFESESASSGLRDVVWALLNTKEFIVNH